MSLGSGSPIDEEAIRQSVSIFYDRLGRMVQNEAYRNSKGGPYESTPISIREARLTLAPGIESSGGYLDLQWWTNGDYKYHYQEDDLLFRFGREADNESTDKPVVHFHPPDDPDAHDPSCIEDGLPPNLVTLAVIANWIPAVRQGNPSVLNRQSNPP